MGSFKGIKVESFKPPPVMEMKRPVFEFRYEKQYPFARKDSAGAFAQSAPRLAEMKITPDLQKNTGVKYADLGQDLQTSSATSKRTLATSTLALAMIPAVVGFEVAFEAPELVSWLIDRTGNLSSSLALGLLPAFGAVIGNGGRNPSSPERNPIENKEGERVKLGPSPVYTAGVGLAGGLIFQLLTKHAEFPKFVLYGWSLLFAVSVAKETYQYFHKRSLWAKEIDFPRSLQRDFKRSLTPSELSQVDRLVENYLKTYEFEPFHNPEFYSGLLPKKQPARVNWGNYFSDITTQKRKSIAEALVEELQYTKDERELKSLLSSYKDYLGKISLLLAHQGFYHAFLFPFYKENGQKRPINIHFDTIRLLEQVVKFSIQNGLSTAVLMAILNDLKTGHRKVVIDSSTNPGWTLFKIVKTDTADSKGPTNPFDEVIFKIEE